VNATRGSPICPEPPDTKFVIRSPELSFPAAPGTAIRGKGPRAEIESVVRRIEKIETAIEPAFQRHFVAAMAFPNKEDAFPNLARRVELPARKEPSAEGRAQAERGAATGTV
jgi:uncharacterized 2Fe-2S/4Fe-4S cluster protein (DUF4445 family)